MDSPSESFASLMSRARDGDQAALLHLSQTYENQVRLVARVLLGPAMRPYFDSVDFVQSVHRSILIGLRHDKYDVSNSDNLVGLAVTIVRRKVARQWRHMKRQVRLDSETGEIGKLPDALLLLTSADDPAQSADFADRVQHVCRHLNADERDLIERRLQGFSTVEVAEQIGVNPATLRVRLNRLRQRLRAKGLLEEWL